MCIIHYAESAISALNCTGVVLGGLRVRVSPSKTPVTQRELKDFFRTACGEIQHLRLLGDYHHQTRIAFIEFTLAESAISALNCTGVVLGGLRVRIDSAC
ncbi:hypothetical protein F2Q70_00032403 [Brassica cretica]|uniref:RRM domain-containing protein n=1 Tax=Brassica cretica TaxID=69181 RepID=A0A8S9FDR4_BRACR|nr:hypothetical protein F2Q70_00032403 [Brassica cretica]